MLRSPWEAGDDEGGKREAHSLRRSRDIRVEGQSAKHAPNDEDDKDDGARSAVTPDVLGGLRMKTDDVYSRPGRSAPAGP